MARKLTHVGIAVILLTFLIGSISLFIAEADQSASVSSGIVVSSFESYSEDLDNSTRDLNVEITDKIDNETDLTIEEGQLLDDRATDTYGIINLFSKNILVGFLSNVSNTLQIPGVILAFLLTVTSFIVMMLVVRGIWGEGKI